VHLEGFEQGPKGEKYATLWNRATRGAIFSPGKTDKFAAKNSIRDLCPRPCSDPLKKGKKK